jgi:hypothetical protein
VKVQRRSIDEFMKGEKQSTTAAGHNLHLKAEQKEDSERRLIQKSASC